MEDSGWLEALVQDAELQEPALSGSLELFTIVAMEMVDRYERTGLADDIDLAIKMAKKAVELTPVDHPDRAMHLNNFGNVLQSRFERTGSMDDLEHAIATTEQAIELTPHGHPDRAAMMNNLGNVLQMRFERTGSMDDLHRAVVANERAVESTPADHPDRAATLNSLGNALQVLFERTGSMNDLHRAIVINEQAVESTTDDHPDRAMCLNNLGNALQCLFERTGVIEDVDRAILINDQAVELTPHDDPDRAGRLNNLGNVLQCRFERTGSIDDLDRSIVTNEQAVESTPLDHPDRAMYLNSLGTALQSRFELTGSMDDLDRAIETKQLAVESTPDDYPVRAVYLNNLGNALQRRFERTGSTNDLDRAIVVNAQAVESTADDHPDLAMYLNSLANAMQSQFEQTGSMNDFDRVFVIREQAIELTPEDHPDRARYLNNLGNALQRRFNLTGLIDDLNHAIMTREQAIESIPDDHPDRAMYLNNLATSLQSRFEQTRLADDLERAIVTNEQALASDTAPPSMRLRAASDCSDLLVAQRSYNRAKTVLYSAVHLLPTISPRALKRTDQQHNISQFSNITSRAVSLYLEDAEDPYQSLQLLELGRGILANLQLEVRSDISVLAASYPDLAKRFQDLRDLIDPPSSTFGSPMIVDSSATSNSPFVLDSSKSIAERRALITQFDNLLRSIRSLQGFENFLQGPSESELLSLAEDGPIIVFNVSDIRSDAFLITTSQIHSIHLPLLTSDSLEDSVGHFFDAIDEQRLSRYSDANREMKGVIEWLWDVAVSPVLDELGFTQMPPRDGAWPRVWWVGSGLLNILPIHASGYHDSISGETALDRVISSYAPTVKSLAYARERAARAVQVAQQEKAILVAMPTTPEQKPLPFVKMEVKELNNLFSRASIDVTIIQNPTRADAISELPKYSIVHFSCHGYPADDPSQSSLLLDDWKTEPLTVSDLTSLHIDSGKVGIFICMSYFNNATFSSLR